MPTPSGDLRGRADDRPAPTAIDLEALVTRTEGMTPAAIGKIVDIAAIEVFREATQSVTARARHRAPLPRSSATAARTARRSSTGLDSLILPDEMKARFSSSSR